MRDDTRPTTAFPARHRWPGRLAAGALLALGAACGEVPTGPEAASAGPRLARVTVVAAAAAVDLTGVWSYHEDATLVLFPDPDAGGGAQAFRCSSDGRYTFAQTGDAFTGSYVQTGTCTAADGTSFPNDFDGVTVTGTVQGRHLTFQTADGCTYEAAVRGAALDAMGGAASCGGPKFGGTYRATFSATR